MGKSSDHIMVNCPTCGGSGMETVERLETYRNDKGESVGRTVRLTWSCTSCDGAGVIPGAPA